MPRLKDIAQKAHVDVSTVSRALNDSPYIHPSTKRRILQVASELRYGSNATKEILTGRRVHAVGIIVPDIELNIFMDFVREAEVRATKENYDLVVCLSGDDAQRENRLLKKMRAGLVDGIVITSTGENNALLNDINASGIPVVQVLRDVSRELDCVSVDYAQSVRSAFTVLQDSGCQQIALINGPSSDISYHEKAAVYKQLTKEVGYPAEMAELDTYPHSFVKAGYDLFKELYSKTPNIDGVMVANDSEALGVLQYAEEYNIKIPETVKLISLAGGTVSRLTSNKVSAIDFPSDELARRAIHMVITKVEKLEQYSEIHRVNVQTRFEKRKTC